MSARIGIEIGTTAVRVAVTDSDNPPKLLGVRSVPLAIDELPAPKRGEAIAAAVSKAVKPFRRRFRAVGRPGAYLSIEGLKAITRVLELPSLSDTELAGAAALQAGEVSPFAVEDAVLASRRLSGQASAPGRERVLVGIAHRELIDPLVGAIERAGVRVLGVDLAASALVRALTQPAAPSGPCEALVVIGAELTTLVVHTGGELVFVRTFAGGGADVSRAIARRLDVPVAEAERLKLALPSFDRIDEIQPELLVALRDGATELVAEIRSSLEYYASQPVREEVSRVLLCGGGSLLPGLVERVALQTRLPVALVEDLPTIATSAPDVALTPDVCASFAVALGAALTPTNRTRALDLLPPEERERRRAHATERAALLGATISLGALAGLGTVHTLAAFSAEHAASSLQTANAALSQTLSGYRHAATDHDAVVEDAALVGPILASEVNWPAVLRALAAATPNSVASSSFEGEASSGGATTTSATTDSASPPGSDIGTVELSLSGSSYPAFQTWFHSISATRAFQILEFSGLSSESSAVQFSAELGITPSVRSGRATEFKAPRS